MSDPCVLPQPTPEHRRLADCAGSWDVDCTYFMGPEPMKNTARETVELIGPFWTVAQFEAEMMGQPFRGRGTMGFEPTSGQWVSTWIDSMSPALYVFRGSADGDVLTMFGEGPHPMTQKSTTFRTVERWLNSDRREFDMYCLDADGNEQHMFHYVYRRA